jgi:hypothetical protein
VKADPLLMRLPKQRIPVTGTIQVTVPVLIFLHLSVLIRAQEPAQVIRGMVTEATTRKPVAHATVRYTAITAYTAHTDGAGNYSIHASPGKYLAVVTHSLYRALVVQNIVVVSGKQTVTDFALDAMVETLDPVIIRAGSDPREVPLDLWNLQHFAAVFYDPARVANSHAGVVNIDDGTNHMTVRGSSPSFIQWKLEDVEIVNPNHLENGGTISDRPAPNGGGVSMISAQLLERSSFRFPPFDAMYGNALAGVLDMKLRTGNNEKREHVVQASLIGVDLSTEGPLSGRRRGSYLLNVRYSTIGLLNAMGVDFGDEQSAFADISHLVVLPFRNGSFRIFGINGYSLTKFSGKRDSSLLEIQKELQDISYNSTTAVNGLSAAFRTGSRGFLKTVFVYSAKGADRYADPVSNSLIQAPSEKDIYQQRKLSTLSYYSAQAGSRVALKAGSYVNYFTSALGTSEAGGNITRSNYKLFFQPFVAADILLGKNLSVTAGLHAHAEGNYFNLQPRAAVTWFHPVLQQFRISYGSATQLHDNYLSLSHSANRNLSPIRNHAASLSHAISVFSVTLRNEIYYQDYRGLASDSATGFSAFNYFNELLPLPLSQKSNAIVYGYDVRLERAIGQFYFIAAASFYQSQFEVRNGEQKAARFGTGRNVFVTAGREQKLKTRPHFWSVDIRGVHRPGFLESGDSVPAVSASFGRRLPDYWRIDLRLSYKKNKPESTVIWALDIQNVTARRNVAYHYYDRVTRRTETKYHLGLIPVLSYKVMF